MLNLILYYQTQSLNQAFFSNKENLIIVPGPVEADEVRKSGAYAEVRTIAEFLRNLDKDIRPTRKSELYHLLATLCKNVDQELKISEFDEVFKWLTDIRNNIGDEEVIEEIFSLFDEKTSKLLFYCSEFINKSDYFDEAKIYKCLIEKERSLERGKIVFTGFKHLSSLQLDFLGALAKVNNIFVTAPYLVFQKSEHNDWIQWGSFDNQEIIDSEGDHIGSVLPLEKSQLAKFLGTQKNEGFIYFSNQISLDKFAKFGQYKSQAKFSIDYFRVEKDWLRKEFRQVSLTPMKVEKFLEVLTKDVGRYFKRKEPKRYKILLDLKELILKTQDLTDGLTHIDDYYFRLFLNIIDLNLPRTSLISSKGSQFFLTPRAYEFGNLKATIAFLDSDFLNTSYSFDTMPIELKTRLAQLGVIKRSSVEESYHMSLVQNYLYNEDNVLVYEKTDEHDEIFKNYNRFVVNSPRKNENKNDYLQKEISEKKPPYFSASRLQTYKDCPRRYHFQYRTDRLKEAVLNDEVTAFEKGNWEHQIIKDYFEGKEKSEIFVSEQLEITLSNKNIKRGELEVVKADSLRRIENGISFVKELLKNYPGGNFSFEKSINSSDFRGSIDLLVESGTIKLVIDFKRSKGSIPSMTEVKSFDSLQVLAYINRANVDEGFIGGYFCLDTPEDSLFFGTEKNLGNYRCQPFTKEQVELYRESEKALCSIIEMDKIFIPKPRKTQICTYCDLRNLCPKQ